MISNNTNTLDASTLDTRSGATAATAASEGVPRLRVLYHIDLPRIGAVSCADIPLADGDWQIVGRSLPEFVDPGASGTVAPLSDPTISRKQLRVRWRPELEAFEVEPLPGAKRQIRNVTAEAASRGSRGELIEDRITIAPGGCIAVEDRLLLALELVSCHRAKDADRLGLIGESEVMWRLRQDICEVAEFERPALILGATGAGKEVVAHAVHQQSARAASPLVVANCAALPDNLIDSLLFGHVKGAFTGADNDQPGLFRAAHGGVLFLDELGELPASLQPKLLRTVQDGKVTPLGQHDSVQVDVRLIAATNRNPEAEIAAGRLREDLYHRMAGHLLYLPTLNRRRFDIPELFVHFLERFGAAHPRASWLWQGAQRWRRTIPLRFFVELMLCDWSGNVRQLQNIVDRTIRRNLAGAPFRPPSLPSRQQASPAFEQSFASPLASGAETVSATPAAAHLAPGRQAAHDEQIAFAARALDLAHKTVRKLLTPQILASLPPPGLVSGDVEDRTRVQALEAALEARLFQMLSEHDFKPRPIAALLNMSPSTFSKLVQRFGIPRPSDLSLETIQVALKHANDSMAEAARALRVSEQGLKRRLTLLNLKKNA